VDLIGLHSILSEYAHKIFPFIMIAFGLFGFFLVFFAPARKRCLNVMALTIAFVLTWMGYMAKGKDDTNAS
jgi:hypothetical protein